MEENKYNNELTLTEIINFAKDYFKTFLKFSPLIALAGLLLGGYFYYKEISKPYVYTASLKFMLNTDESSGGGGLLGQFGGLLGSTSDDPNLKRMEGLMKTKKIIKTVLFTKVKLNGKEDFLANHYIDEFKMHDTWKEAENEKLANFYFTSTDFENFDRLNNGISNGIHNKIVNFTEDGELMAAHLRSEFDDSGSGIIDVWFSSSSEAFSYQFLKTFFDVLSNYYVERTIEKQRSTFNLVRQRTDSLKKALASKEYQIANFKDSNKGIFRSKSLLNINDLQRESNFLSTMYAQSLNSLESARLALQVQTPYINALEEPMYPIGKSTKKERRKAILGAFIGCILMTIVVLGIKLIRYVLDKERAKEALRQQNKMVI